MVLFTKGVVDCVDLTRNLYWCVDDVLIMMLQSYHPLRYQMRFGEAWHASQRLHVALNAT